MLHRSQAWLLFLTIYKKNNYDTLINRKEEHEIGTTKEIWRPIPIVSLLGVYEVSNRGRVKKLSHYSGNSKTLLEEKIMSQRRDKYGYNIFRAQLNGKVKDYKTHRLVALAFIPNKDGKKQVNHIDGNKTNNNVANLEWCTPKENMANAVSRGVMRGQSKEWLYKNHCTKVLQKKNGSIIASYDSVLDAAKATGLADSNIFRAMRSPDFSAGGFQWVRV